MRFPRETTKHPSEIWMRCMTRNQPIQPFWARFALNADASRSKIRAGSKTGGDPMHISVNGEDRVIGDDVDPKTPLLWVLRDHLSLVGTKYGCGIAQC